MCGNEQIAPQHAGIFQLGAVQSRKNAGGLSLMEANMKKAFFLAMALSLVGGAAFAQLRLDIGIAAPIGVGSVLDGTKLQMNGLAGNFLSKVFLPLPEAALHYQFDLAAVKLGIGARAFTLIVETVIWPNAFAEFDLGPVDIEAQVGGGAFAFFGLVSDFETGRVFFPDLSAWLKLGKDGNLRLGAGLIGLFLPNQTSNLPVVLYLGGKLALKL